ncbi:glycoside hydrolase family 2 protein [Spirosoma panaciterrae]|uniref:glycoside hydrolase family 2 protein n=1 Tax=Spirosoma panaciterrae TaxID=496058 RepID=UPI000375E860|nr:glycoside hydrolase family 2 [Spirosoma panaciterrae]
MRHHLFLFFLVVPFSLAAQYAIRDPNAIPLHGDWAFALDPAEMGESNGWFRTGASLQRWDNVTVPHCFSSDKRYLNYTGIAWYRRTFSWHKKSEKRVLLHVDAAFYKTTVYLNNQKIGTHEGGYTPFQFDITDQLISGENTLALSVDNNTLKPGTVPGAKDNGQPNDPFMGWVNYGGLIRPVYLTVEPALYIERVKVEALPDLATGTATITVRTRVRNTRAQTETTQLALMLEQNKQPIATKWLAKAGSIAAGQTAWLEATTTLKAAQVKRWQLDSPSLYDLQTSMGTDTVRTSFGIRKVEVRNAQLLLNGEPLRLAGGNRVVDYPGLGSMEPDWLVEADLRQMKQTGMEFHRLTHYTPSETVYDWADRNGMLIVAEAGNWQLTPRQMANEAIRSNFRQQFQEMVERDWNHPSVIAYSVGNEYESRTPEGQQWTKDMIAYARQLDPTRLYTFATMRLNQLPEKPEEEASQYVDFVSTNTYGNPAKVLDRIHELYPDKPILISEYGIRADGQQGEAGQVAYLTDYLNAVRKRPYVVGMSWWSFNDYQSRFQNTNPNGFRPWGLVDNDRNPRPLYKAHQREMAPLTLEKVQVTPGDEGVHTLRVRLTARADFPAYPIRYYLLKTPFQQIRIPDLQPGQHIDIDLTVRGFERRLLLEIRKPTGYTVFTQTIDLTNDTRTGN